jgi:PAS domain S-box-containing protein
MSGRSSDGVQPDVKLARALDSQMPHYRIPGSASPLLPPASEASASLPPGRELASSHSLALEIQNRELREAQRSLERARTRYFEFFDSSPIAYFVFDERHHLEELNAVGGELLGGGPTKWRHRPFFPLLVEADRQRFHHHLQRVLRERLSEEIELKLVGPDSKVQKIRLLSQYVRPEPGERPVSLSAAVLIPDALASTHEPGPREGLWGKHLTHSATPAAVAALQGGWLFSNPAFRACVEYSEEELEARGWIALTHVEDREREVVLYNRLLSGETDSYQLDKRLLQKCGTLIWVRASVSCTRTKDGRPDLLFYTLQRLAPPMAVEPPIGSPAGRDADGAGGPVDLQELLSEGRAQFADPTAPCRLRWVLAPGLPRLVVQRRQMLGVLHHLIRNAREAIGSGPGRITVSTGRQYVEPDLFEQGLPGSAGCSGDCIFLEVSDEGCGMSAEVQSQACQPYFSLKPGHAGMGLTTVAAVMREHRGGLRIQSQRGKGTSVKLLFPETLSQQEIAVDEASDFPSTTLDGRSAAGQGRVLLVDDESGVREITARMIEALGFEVEEAAGGAEGLSLYLRQPDRFSIVVADITMPGMDGLQLFDELRARRGDLPFVLMSGFCEASAMSHREAGLTERGAAVFLQKPFTFHRLQEVLQLVQAGPSSSWP